MQHPDPEGTGARDRSGKSVSSSTAESIRVPRRNQTRPLGPGDQAALEARIEQLAYGEVLPDDLSEVRRIWWDLARQGMRLPAQPGVLLIHGGVDG